MKNKVKKYFFAYILCVFVSCNESDSNMKELPIYSFQELKTKTIKIDSLILEPSVFSGRGFFQVFGDSIYFTDNLYSTVSAFDKDGKFSQRYLGKGEGPNEIEKVYKMLFLKDGRRMVMGDFIYTLFNNSWQKLAKRQIDWEYQNKNVNDLENNPNPALVAMYGFNWMTDEASCFAERSNNRIVFPIVCEHPKMNAFEHEEYYKKTRILAELNINTGKISNLFGRFSPEYLKHQFIPNFTFYQFVVTTGDSLIVSFAADSLMHIYDSKNNLVKKFGVAGDAMKTDYKRTKGNFEEVESNFKMEMKRYGYYDYLYYDKASGFIFRSYKRGGAETSGLQIYNGQHTLIADVNTPWNFKVLGFIAPYFYASGIIDEENEKLGIYRFKLN